MTIRETRKRLLRAMDALIADGKKQLEENHAEYAPNIKSYIGGLRVAKKAIIKIMDNPEQLAQFRYLLEHHDTDPYKQIQKVSVRENLPKRAAGRRRRK